MISSRDCLQPTRRHFFVASAGVTQFGRTRDKGTYDACFLIFNLSHFKGRNATVMERASTAAHAPSITVGFLPLLPHFKYPGQNSLAALPLHKHREGVPACSLSLHDEIQQEVFCR